MKKIQILKNCIVKIFFNNIFATVRKIVEMERIIIVIVLFFNLVGNAQDNSVEKNIFGIQTGLFGAWITNETRLANKFSLRSEIGMDLGLVVDYGDDVTSLFIPTIRMEPRWHYNLDKRVEKGRSIKNNSSNFLALNFIYSPDWFYISKMDNINVISTLSIIPKWAIKRNIGSSNFNYEAGFGIGYAIYFEEYGGDRSGAAVDLHARIGYTF